MVSDGGFFMIDVKESLLVRTLNKAINKVKKYNESRLVSVTQKIDMIDPIHFFEAAKQLKKDRVFWSSVADDYYLVGIGRSVSITSKGERFSSTEKQWQNILKRSVIHNTHSIPGTGLTAIGGMSFDPKKKRSGLWRKYSESDFTIPEYVLVKKSNHYYLTANVEVHQDSVVNDITRTINHDKDILLNTVVTLPKASSIRQTEEVAPSQWLKTVAKAIETVKHNQVNKIVLAREIRLKLEHKAEISPMLEKLIDMQTNSYVFAFEKEEDCFIGATPERLVSVEGDRLLSTCLAGTAPRGETEEEDNRIAEDLFSDSKNRAEHDYVVKMIRNSIQPSCSQVEIPKEPIVYPFKNLHHLYTPVYATLKPNYSILDIVEKLHPTPALGGEPKEASLSFIRQYELLDRGWYGAPIGWFDSQNNGEFAVAIRSGLMQGDEASLFAGGGIMKDSNPAEEYEETNIKFLPMLSVMED